MAPSQQPVEVMNGQAILYRAQHFFLSTAYRPGVRPPRMPWRPNARKADAEARARKKEEEIKKDLAPAIIKQRRGRFPVPRWMEAIVILVGLAISVAAHVYNLFNFPRYEMDEGTYMSAAYAVMNGKIWPFAYGYGHPPFAWMQIAGAIPLMGGFFTFGNALNTGRVLMLFYAVASALLVYLVVRRLGGSRSAGLLGMIIFSLSPLAITYQRQVLLDNVAVFWFLLSLYFLVTANSRLLHLVLAALFFGLSVLSKEVMGVLLPAMIYGLWIHSTVFQRKFSLVAFTYVAIVLISLWPLMAMLRGELFPSAWHLFGDTHGHLSFLDTLASQVKRTGKEGSVADSWPIWVGADWVIIACSIVTTVFNLALGWWNRKQLFIGLLAVSYWALLLRPNGVVLSFYFIPLIPIVAINTAFTVNTIMDWMGQLVSFDLVRAILILMVVAVLVPYDIQAGFSYVSLNPTSVENNSLLWARDHIPRNSFVLINSWAYMDMRVPGGLSVGNGAAFTNAQIYINVAADPEILRDQINSDWNKIDYIIADSEMMTYITGYLTATPGQYTDNNPDPAHRAQSLEPDKQKVLLTAFNHSIQVADFKYTVGLDVKQWFEIQIFQVIHKNPAPTVLVAPTPGSGSGGSAPVASMDAIVNRTGLEDRRL
jgi:4-amino-4-deoxy-L-arabinose transferase-like glycosyltransferase